MKKTKGFAYDTEKDKDVIEYIEKQPVQNQYIWGLVRADMNKSDSNIKDLVKKYVEELLKDKDIQFDDKKEGNISKDDVTNLLSMFDD